MLAPVEAAADCETGAMVGSGLDLDTVDANRRRAEKPLDARRLLVFDSDLADIRFDVEFVNDAFDQRAQAPVRGSRRTRGSRPEPS